MADSVAPAAPLPGAGAPRRRNDFARTVRALLAHGGGLFGALIIVLVVFGGLLAPVLTPYDPYAINMAESLEGPSWRHPFGTDPFGRDLLTRILYGARFSLQISILSRLIAVFLGAGLGLVAGYFGGRLDNLVMRMADITLAYPGLLLLIAVMAAVGPSTAALFVSLGIVGWAGVARIVRAQVLSIKERDYVLAAQSLGVHHGRVMLTHILPNVVTQLLVVFSIGLGAAIMAESSLSFLGLGAQPPTASWGVMISAGLDYLRVAPWLCIAPGLVITATILGFNLLGDALRDVLDPRLTGRR